MGFLVVHAGLQHFQSPRQLGVLAVLAAASACLYTAGMVLNDVFDAEVDARERPFRPIPSGRVALPIARLLGWELLLMGVGLAWAAAWLHGSAGPGNVATLLAACVVLYDAWLKKTPLGPLGMGACRTLNVAMGLSTGVAAPVAWHWAIAAGIGVYIAGVTWFARSEAEQSRRLPLLLAVAVMIAGIALLASFPWWTHADGWRLKVPQPRWHLFWVIIGALIVWRLLRAVVDPQPRLVQLAVKQSLLSLILLDAALVFAIHGFGGPGIPWAVLVLLLLVPTMFLGRWIYST